MEREEEAEKLVVHWMEGQPAPDAVLNLLAFNCPKKNVHSQDVCVLQMVSDVLTRVDLQTVITRHRPQTVRKVQMRIWKFWKIFMIIGL